MQPYIGLCPQRATGFLISLELAQANGGETGLWIRAFPLPWSAHENKPQQCGELKISTLYPVVVLAALREVCEVLGSPLQTLHGVLGILGLLACISRTPPTLPGGSGTGYPWAHLPLLPGRS